MQLKFFLLIFIFTIVLAKPQDEFKRDAEPLDVFKRDDVMCLKIMLLTGLDKESTHLLFGSVFLYLKTIFNKEA
ncbi:unnamed protein product [Rhizophagus irregularis]|nr:unnamed protein product [Rhizophagus irregularis]